MNEAFKSGFVTVMGRPNVGKSTLVNQLMQVPLAITSPKAQTTRHRLFGILSTASYQLIVSDTPGMIAPNYALQEKMMNYVRQSLEDADVLVYVVSLEDKDEFPEYLDMARETKTPLRFVINKIDEAKGSQVYDKVCYWHEKYPELHIHTVSASTGEGVDALLDELLALTPVHPPYYPTDALTDRPERFFVEEIVREKIFLNYQQEIPYSTQVRVEQFKESDEIIRIEALIFVERDSQKGILIGKGGQSIKKVGTEARLDLESFFGKQIHLDTRVKVAKDWRKNERTLKDFGY